MNQSLMTRAAPAAPSTMPSRSPSKSPSKSPSTMPDIADAAHTGPRGELDLVGMSGIGLPLRLRDGSVEHALQAQARVFVDLRDAHARGIHMSRLYLELERAAQTGPLTASGLTTLLDRLHATHRDLSRQASVRFDFTLGRHQRALLSDNTGWALYPAWVAGTREGGQARLELGVRVTYSSTCPCSAALARQLIQRAFAERFDASRPLSFQDVEAWLGTEQGIVATPHSQRSFADVQVQLSADAYDLPLSDLIDLIEAALGTPVQTAVKREDEQEFARLNGANLMFCEDAARKLKRTLDHDDRFADYLVRIDHHESLHAHDAVAVVSKGVPGGYRAAG